jgi:nucleotide-binding universal stress UspA family protein
MKILVAVDGSACSKAAVRFVASRLARNAGTDARIELVNVQLPIPSYPARLAGAASVHAFHASEAKKALAPAAAILRKAGIKADTRYVVGSPGATISSIAARDADLVVMGSHGHTSLVGLLFGSVTTTVLATSATPLLIVRAKGARKTNAPLRIGVAVDGSRQSLAAVRYMLKHRGLFGAAAEITLLNVVPDPLVAYVPGFAEIPVPQLSPERAVDFQNEMFDAAMRPARTLLKRMGVLWSEMRLVGNSPGDRITAYARASKLDLLVMGSHGYGALKSVVLGSVATRVAAGCNTPLLVVRSVEVAAQRRHAKERSRLGPALA